MRFRPDITSPCPVADRLSTLMDGDVCRHCDKRVFDLDAMSSAACNSLFAEAKDDPCVRYRAPAALAAAALAAALIPGAASAQTGDAPPPTTEEQEAGSYEIIVGGARRLTYDERMQLRLESYWEEEREGRKRRNAKARAAAAS